MKLNESEIMEKIAYRIGIGNFISSDAYWACARACMGVSSLIAVNYYTS